MNWFSRIPKVELHLHLEGAIPLATLWELVLKAGGDPEVPDIEALRRRFTYTSFPEFIRTYMWKNRFLREYDDFAHIAEAVARDLARQNVRYAEVFFSPYDFARQGLGVQPIAEAIRRGFSRVKGVRIALVADLVRNYGPEQGLRTLAELREIQSLGIIGIGIGGAEHQFPASLFTQVFETARQWGFRTTAHAGEAVGAQSVWSAIRDLRVERIGHGTRAIEDDALVDFLAERRIAVELCPLSNVKTGVVPHIKSHPAKHYFDRGLLVTINTDDPGMFGNSLEGEYLVLHEELGFSRSDIRKLILNSIEASWLSEHEKLGLAEEFELDETFGTHDAV